MAKMRSFTYIIFALAVIAAVLSVTMPLESMNALVLFSRFFEVMIPILAVGALVKYLCCGGQKNQ